jgi:hypothetical protein
LRSAQAAALIAQATPVIKTVSANDAASRRDVCDIAIGFTPNSFDILRAKRAAS